MSGAFDWAELARERTSTPGEPVVDVVIALSGHHETGLRTLHSVLSAQQQTPIHVIVCGDDETLGAELRDIAALGLIELAPEDPASGRAATFNHAFGLHPDRDVVVLAPDVLVFNDWLDRLRSHATARDDVGTISPLTPGGELGGYPVMGRVTDGSLEVSPEELDALAASVNARAAVDAPTGDGSCLYLTRRFLEITGGFDAEAFGSDGGAEDDVCQRGIAAGLRSLVCADVYVWTSGRGGTAETPAVESRHPGFAAALQAFVSDDPLKLARCRLDAARITRAAGSADKATLQVLHAQGGGTERHVRELSAHLRSEARHSVYCQPVDAEEGTFRFFDPNVSDTPNLADLNARVPLSVLVGLFDVLRIDTIHIHHLLGYPGDAAAYFTGLADATDVSLDVTLHDYLMVCPRINLVSAGGAYCGEPDEAACQRCIDTLGSPVGTPTVWLWRRSHGAMLRAARHVWAPSNDVVERMGRYFPDVIIELKPHQELVSRPVDRSRPPQRSSSISRIAVLGALNSFKGSRVVLDVARAASAEDLPIQIVLIGHSNIDEKLLATGKVHVTGPYQEDQLGQLIHDEGIDAVWFPAVWPETFSFTLTAALETDLPIVAFDLGAVAERLRAVGRASHVVPLSLKEEPDRLLGVLRESLPPDSPARRN